MPDDSLQMDAALLAKLRGTDTVVRTGRLSLVQGTTIRATGLQARIGQLCHVVDPAGGGLVRAEVIGFSGQEAILTPLDPLQGVSINAEVRPVASGDGIRCGDGMKGRVLDAGGAPIDGLGPIEGPLVDWPLYAPAPNPMHRPPIDKAISTGVRAIDTMLTTGEGQRMGIFAAAGVGKSTLLGMLARNTDADIIVIGLIGERGRELREMLIDSLGEEGLKRSVVVAATSDRPSMERARAAHAATAIAEAGARAGAGEAASPLVTVFHRLKAMIRPPAR